MSDNLLKCDEEGYLLYRGMHKSKLKRRVDLKSFDWLWGDYKTQVDRINELTDEFDARKWYVDCPDTDRLEDEIALAKLYKYEFAKSDDRVYLYDDIGDLSGSAGYVLIRDGFILNDFITERS